MKKHMQVVSEAEQKLAALQKQKEKVQSIFFYHGTWSLINLLGVCINLIIA